MHALARFALTPARRFSSDGGATAVEFALVLPILILLYLGGVDVTHGITVDRKVTAATSAIGDLVAQAEGLDAQEMDGIFNAAAAIIEPYDAGPLSLVISTVQVTEDGGEVVCSRALNGTPHATGTALELPEGLAVPGTSLVVSEAQYAYRPLFGLVFSEAVDLSEVFYLRPRTVDQVDLECA